MRTSTKFIISQPTLEEVPKLKIAPATRTPKEEDYPRMEKAAMKRIRRRQRNIRLANVGGFQ